MPNVISSFLVGVGFDVDTQSENKVTGAIKRVESRALQMGAVIAGAFGANALTFGFTGATNAIDRFSQVFGVLPEDVGAFGRALELQGGSLQSFMSQLEGIERLRAGLLVGDVGFIAQAGRAGIETGPIIESTNALEAYLQLADQFAGMSQQQRLNAADALGLDTASIRLLSMGRDAVSDVVQQQREMRPVTEEMIGVSREFNQQFLELQTNVNGVADAVSVNLLPALNKVLDGTNDWIEANKELLGVDIAEYTKRIAENAGIIAAAYAGYKVAGPKGAAVAALSAGVISDNPTYFEDSKFMLEKGFRDIQDALGFGVEEAVSAPAPEVMLPPQFSADVPLSSDPRFLERVEATNQVRDLRVILQMDGNVIDERVINVMDQQADQAAQDLTSSVEG